MEKKILIAIDDSTYSGHAVEYAVQMSSVVEDLSYTLFHVQPTISGFLQDEAKTNLKARTKLKKIFRRNAEDAEELLKRYKARMVRRGVAEERIDLATRPKMLGVARDILDYAEQNLYDAVVVGRRGLSRVQEAFMGSVTANIVEHSRVIPVWVIDGNVTSTSIMVAVDGSESSLRAADHVGFMVRENPEIKVTLFHVVPTVGHHTAMDVEGEETGSDHLRINGNKQAMDRFCANARKKFKEAGIREDQIEIRVNKCMVNVSKSIVDEAEKGNYGTVVVGRRGAGSAFFMGSVSRHVLERASNRALWLVSDGH